MTALREAGVIIAHAMSESLRRRVIPVVGILTVLFLVLYAVGASFAFEELETGGFAREDMLDETALVGGTVFGLAMFATLFLGSVLAVFLTSGVVRGDAESGLLQPLVVRPIGRGTVLVARWVGAVAATTAYVAAVYFAALAITLAVGDWEPGAVVLPGLALALAVAIVAALSLVASVYLASAAQGIAVFMVFGAGLVAGLLGQIGEALASDRLERIAEAIAIALPFEAIYQAALHLIATDEAGVTRAVIELGPFGGSEEGGPGLALYSLLYVAGLLAWAVAAFRRRDL
jgi:Cu-processing system permease protein